MPTIGDFIKQLESQPAFARLTYDQQKSARADLLGPLVLADPEVRPLPPQQQEPFLSAVVFRPPVAETSGGQEAVDTFAARAALFKTRGLRDLIQEGVGPALKYDVEVEMPTRITATYQLLKAGLNETYVWAAVKSFMYTAPRLAQKVVERLGPGSNLAKTVANVNAQTDTWRRDQTKYDAYAVDMLSRGEQFQREGYGTAINVLKTTVNLAELAAIGAGAAAIVGLPSWGAAVASRSLSGLLKAAKPVVKIALLEGGAQFGRDIVKNTIANPEGRETLGQLVKKFGPDVAWNTAALVGIQAASLAVAATPMLFGKTAAVRSLRKGISYDDLMQLTDDISAMRQVDPASYATAPDEVQATIRQQQGVYAVAHNPQPTEIDVLVAHAWLEGYETIANANGSFTMKPFVKGLSSGRFKSQEGFENWLSERIARRITQDETEAAAKIAASKDLGVEYSSDWINAMARKKWGMPIRQTSEGFALNIIDDYGNPAVKTFKTLPEAGDYLLTGGIEGNKIDAALMPDGAIIIDGQPSVRFQDTVVTGNRQQVYRHFDNYRSRPTYNLPTFIKTEKDVRLYNKVNFLEVHDPGRNYRRTFTKADDAIKWLQGGEDNYLKLADEAADKGWALTTDRGRWMLYDDAGKPLVFDSMEDVRKALPTVPIPEEAPVLLGIPRQIDDALAPPVNLTDHNFDHGKPTKPLGIRWLARKAATPVTSAVENAVNRGATPKIAADLRGVQIAENMRRTNDAITDYAVDATFAPIGQKRLVSGPDARYARLFEAETREAALKVIAKDKLPDDAMDFWGRYRDFMGRNEKQGIALFSQTGRRMAEGEFIQGYLPRQADLSKFRSWLLRNKKRAFGDVDIPQMLTEAGIDPAHLEFFRNMRRADFVDLAQNVGPIDATKAVLRYVNKEKFLNPAVAKLRATLKEEFSAGRVQGPLVDYLTDVVDMLDGKLFNWEMKEASSAINNAITHFVTTIAKPLKGLGFTVPEIKGLTELYQSLVYSSALGLRAYPLMRNMFTQPLMMGARLGNDYLLRAMKMMASAKNRESVLQVIRKAGILLPEGAGNVGMGGKVALGLGIYRRTDDYTRALGWLMTKSKFDEAKALVLAGKIKSDLKFLERSGINTMSDDIQQQIMGLIKNPKGANWEAAHNLYARVFNFETLFPYTRALNPRILQGRSFVGRIFGTFGTFSFWWADALAKQMPFIGRRGDFASRMAFAGRLAVNFAAAGGAAAALGLRWARDWTPWGPIAFSGGPYMEGMALGLASLKPGYRGRQARAEMLGVTEREGLTLQGLWKSWAGQWLLPMPGRVAWSYLNKAWEAFEQGDVLQGIWLTLGAPVNPDYEGPFR